MEYGIVVDGSVREVRHYKKSLKPDQIKHIGGKPMVRPVITMEKPTFDSDNFRLSPHYQIKDDKIERHWDIVALNNNERRSVLNDKMRDLESKYSKDMLFELAEISAGLLPSLSKDTRKALDERRALKGQIDAL